MATILSHEELLSLQEQILTLNEKITDQENELDLFYRTMTETTNSIRRDAFGLYRKITV